jgi:hypothetical protein
LGNADQPGRGVAASGIGSAMLGEPERRLAGESPAGLAAALREAFALVAELDKVVLFIDEVEEIAGSRRPRTVSAAHPYLGTRRRIRAGHHRIRPDVTAPCRRSALIHISTGSIVHSFTGSDLRLCPNYPQIYAQAVIVAGQEAMGEYESREEGVIQRDALPSDGREVTLTRITY